MALALYDPSSVIMYVAGIAVEDVMDGTFITITRDGQVFSSSTTTDGQVYRKRNSINSYTLNLTLSSSSKSSQVLNYFLIADQTTTLAKFPVMVKDTSGSSLFFATTCWIESEPTLSFAENVVARNWTIRCTGCTIVFGDSYGSSSSLEDLANGVISSIPSLTGLI